MFAGRRRDRAPAARRLLSHAPVFAALGDETRLSLLNRLGDGSPRSITQLTAGTRITRQAISKHLRVLAGARLVRGVRHGRESLYQLSPEPLDEARKVLEGISRQWDQALARLKAFVEE
jgi:DNA-binding transcriptional ArsR family regulator